MILLYNFYEQPVEESKQIKVKSINPINKSAHNSDLKSDQQSCHELEQTGHDLNTMLKEKDTLIQETKEKINQEKLHWEMEKQQWIEAAEKEGYDAGFIQGKDECLQAYQQLLDETNALATAALKDYHATVEKSSGVILDLAIHTAKKILDDEFTVDPDNFLPIVKAAMKEINDQPVISIYLHTNNYPAVLQQKEELVRLLESEAKLAIYTREDIAKNSCLIEHPFGQIDASVDTQLKQICNALHTIAAENRS